MYGFKIDDLDKENNIVFFSSPMSSFSSLYSFHECDDGDIERQIIDVCVTVRNQSSVFIDTDGTKDGDIVLDCRLTDDMCLEVARLIEKELLKCKQ